VAQLRSHLLPKAPALAGLVVGWWIANTYTDSHMRSVLRSVGIGSGGTRVVSGSTYKAMSFWMPLLAAALCAYLGERIAGYYGRRANAGTEDAARESA
jgi:Na+/H+-translocating membrane pyrophosphatase